MQTKPKQTAVNISVKTTKYFLVLNISSTGLQSGFIVQGSIIREVQKAILLSGIPILLYIIDDATEIATKGSPIAKYKLVIQKAGLLRFSLFIIASIKELTKIKDKSFISIISLCLQ
ncbi:conserved hypothetical protein [Elizabethkingia anophelis]|nr:conserved hypothetical protein [Elizabethkingia anophelis]